VGRIASSLAVRRSRSRHRKELADAGATTIVNYITPRLATHVLEEIEAAGARLSPSSVTSLTTTSRAHVQPHQGRARSARYSRQQRTIVRDHSFKKMTAQDGGTSSTPTSPPHVHCHFAVPMLLENGWGESSTFVTTGQLVVTFGQATTQPRRRSDRFQQGAGRRTGAQQHHGERRCDRHRNVGHGSDVIKESFTRRSNAPRLHDGRGARGVRFLAVEGAYIPVMPEHERRPLPGLTPATTLSHSQNRAGV